MINGVGGVVKVGKERESPGIQGSGECEEGPNSRWLAVWSGPALAITTIELLVNIQPFDLLGSFGYNLESDQHRQLAVLPSSS